MEEKKTEVIENKQSIQKTNKKKRILLNILTFLICLIVIFIVYELATANNRYYIGEKNIQIPIFLYHNIVTEKKDADYMETKDTIFERQIKDFQNMGYEFISYDDLIAYQKGEKTLKKKTIIIAFDDGYQENYTVALPIIERYQIPIAIFIVDNKVGEKGYLTWDEIRKMSENKLISFYTHGKEHYEFDKKETEQAVKDVKEAHNHIERELRKKVSKVFTYPYGLYKQETIEALAKEGFVQNFTDNKINKSKNLNMNGLHRMYPLEDSTIKILAKIIYRSIRY